MILHIQIYNLTYYHCEITINDPQIGQFTVLFAKRKKLAQTNQSGLYDHLSWIFNFIQ